MRKNEWLMQEFMVIGDIIEICLKCRLDDTIFIEGCRGCVSDKFMTAVFPIHLIARNGKNETLSGRKNENKCGIRPGWLVKDGSSSLFTISIKPPPDPGEDVT